MLSLERCRQLLGTGCKLSDQELERLRDQMYGLADVVVTTFLERRKVAKAKEEAN